ncbi:hypothetical protein LXL04_008428 [Taraxacum kok-saghyz]
MSKSILVVKQPTLSYSLLAPDYSTRGASGSKKGVVVDVFFRVVLFATSVAGIVLLLIPVAAGIAVSRAAKFNNSLAHISLLAALGKAALYGIVTGLISVFASSKLKFHFVILDSVSSSTSLISIKWISFNICDSMKMILICNQRVYGAAAIRYYGFSNRSNNCLEEFRKQYKEENPENKFVAAASDPPFLPHEKAPFQAKADKRKKQYEKDMDTYNNKPAASANDEADHDSDKSKSEVNDEADSDSGDDDDDD